MSTEASSKFILDVRLIGRIISLARPHKLSVVYSIILTILLTILAPIRPLLVQYTIDHPIMNKDTEGITFYSALILIHLLLNSIVLFASTYVTNLLGQKVIKDLRSRVYQHILSLKSRFFDRSKVGMLVTRSVSDVETISSFFSQGFISIVGDLAQIFAVLVVMFLTSWQLTLISLSVLPVLLIASDFFRRGVRKSFQTVRSKVSQMNSFIQEQIVGMEVVQIFGKHDQEFKKFEIMNREHRKANEMSIFYYAIYFPIVEILSSLALGLIIWWSIGFSTQASAGLITAFILYVNLIFRPIRFIADRFNTMQMGIVSSERIFALLDDITDVEDEGTEVIKKIKGSLAFKDVWFAYDEENFVLKGVDFNVNPGHSLAIVGATGAGKSSIISLITRLYECQKGAVLIDGIDVKKIQLNYLRNQIGVVLQDVFLFAGSVEENIRLKNNSIDRDQIKKAASSIGALSFIDKLEGGLNYDVKERGVSLSGGQRQLISFIRAMAANPSVLILDEATSSVDTETEVLIQQAIHKLMINRTSIVIAHRLSTIRNADSILVLDQGKVIELGSHDELIDQKGTYYTLFENQYKSKMDYL
jgi:ATP-binding cassette, subfamily B, multidrug efflux pump